MNFDEDIEVTSFFSNLYWNNSLLGTLFWTQKLEIEASDWNTKSDYTTTKRGMDLGTLVVPFDQTFHLLHRFPDRGYGEQNLAR